MILKSLIREFIRTSRPVGSRRLARVLSRKLSPATIRNVVSDLEEKGFVSQPHVSAGRVPTARGYRFYVDSITSRRPLANRFVDRIEKILRLESDPDELMSRVSQVLSTLSSNVGFVLAPPMSLTVMKHIEFVGISRRRVLVILVSQTGLVQHKIVRLEEHLQQHELDSASRYLVENFAGRTLRAVQEELIALMSEEKALYDRLLQNVILLGSVSLMGAEARLQGESEVYLGGASRIMQQPEFADIQRLMLLFRTLEEKSRLVKILTGCVKQDQEGPTVTIGLEEHIPGMADLALVTSPYAWDPGVSGSLGILGPRRMEYEKAIRLVDYMARVVGEVLHEGPRI